MSNRGGAQPRRAIAATAHAGTGQRDSMPVQSRAGRTGGDGANPGQVAAPGQHLQVLVDRLIAEGINPARARQLVATQSEERIARQLAWIDGRNYRDRAASLIAAIEGDFAPPPPRRTRADEPAIFDRSKYYRGSYALCPRCGCRPCAPGCTDQVDLRAAHR